MSEINSIEEFDVNKFLNDQQITKAQKSFEELYEKIYSSLSEQEQKELAALSDDKKEAVVAYIRKQSLKWHILNDKILSLEKDLSDEL